MRHFFEAMAIHMADHFDDLFVLGIEVVPAGNDGGPVVRRELSGGGSSRFEVAMQVLDRLGAPDIGPLFYPWQIS